jgi:hypothetical protein
MAEIKVNIQTQHLKPGTFWRDYADKVGIEAVLVLTQMAGGEKIHIATEGYLLQQAKKGILYP